MVRKENEQINLTLINDPELAIQNFNPENYDLVLIVLIGFRMSVMDGFDLYDKLHEMSKKSQQDASSSNDFRVCFLTASRINYTALAEIHAEFGEECYVCKEISKENFRKHVYSLISIIINYIISDSNTYTYFCFNICCLFVFFCFHYN
jgi:CheY-like chemotaxis protein